MPCCSNCCGLRERASVILIAIWSIAQSVGFVVMSVLGMRAYSCDEDMTGSRFNYLMYLYYFRGPSCDRINWTYLGINLPVPDIDIPIVDQISYPYETQATIRMNIFLMTYLIISVLWVVTSIWLIIGVFISCMGRCGYHFLFKPWILVCISVIILDVVATSFFISDIINTTTVEKAFAFLEITNPETLIYYIQQNIADVVFIVPPTVAMVTACRGFIFWMLNIAGLLVVLSAGKKFAKGLPVTKQKKKPVKKPDFGYPPDPQIEEMRQHRQPVNQPAIVPAYHQQQPTQSRYTDPAQTHPYAYDNQQYRRSPTPEYQMPRVASHIQEPKKYNPSAPRFDPNENKMETVSSLNDYTMYTPVSNNRNSKQESIRSTKPEPVRNSKPEPPPVSQKPVKPILKSQTVAALVKEEEKRISVNPPAELRGQLPWSYTNNREDISGPSKRNMVQLREDEDLPPVPVPDYTLHFPKTQRNALQPDYEGKFTGPEYRY